MPQKWVPLTLSSINFSPLQILNSKLEPYLFGACLSDTFLGFITFLWEVFISANFRQAISTSVKRPTGEYLLLLTIFISHFCSPLFRQCRLSRGHSSKWDSGYFTLLNFIKLTLFDLITTKVSGRLEVLFFTNVSKHHPLVISCKWLIVGGNNEVSRGRNNRRRKTDKRVAYFSTISRLIK